MKTESGQTHCSLLRSELLGWIQMGHTGDKLDSERNLAQRYGVCRATVNRVLSDLELEGYVVRRSGKGTFIAPRDNTDIREGRASARSGSVISVAPDFFSNMIWLQVHTSELLALKNNLALVSLKLEPYTNFDLLLETARNTQGLTGFVIQPPMEGVPANVLAQLDKLNVPCVILHEVQNVSLYQNMYEVRFDHFKSGYLRMEALLRHGHRKIGFIPNEAFTGMGGPSVLGMRQALKEYGLCWRNIVCPVTCSRNWQSDLGLSIQQTMEVLDQAPVTALIVDTMPGVFGVMRALYQRNLKCPDDISLVTSMGFMGLEELTTPAISSVESDCEELTRRAFDVILGRERNKRVLVDHKLIERESIRDLHRK